MTMLEKLHAQRTELEALPTPAPEQLRMLQEAIYRIGVVECCKAFQLAAPRTAETKILAQHYKLVEAFVQQIPQERQFGASTDETRQKHQATALENLNKVIADYRRRFQSYRPASPEQYAKDIGQALQTVLIAWAQCRNSQIEIKTKESK
jgi:hypothetical protein